MAWDEQKARERVAANDFSDYEINVADLSRTMDFSNLGTKDVRRAEGVHVYADVPNFHRAVADAGEDKAKQKKLIRAASVLRRMQGDIVDGFDVGQIQLQAVRLHGLCFKPYGDEEEERVAKSVCLAVALNTYIYDIFNNVFRAVRDFSSAAGMASGSSYLANIGFTGERELICLGDCANLGAKVLSAADTITVTEGVYRCLPRTLKDRFESFRVVAGVRTYRAKGLRWDVVCDIADDYDLKFGTERLRRATVRHRDNLPLSEMKISDARARIDLDVLTERNSKRTSAVSIYADLDGFTKHVQEAEDDDDVVSLVRVLHMIRREFHAVIQQDYSGHVLQHQGDRVFAMVHMPVGRDNRKRRKRKGLDVAIGLQSSMIHVLNERLAERKDIHVAVGADVGTVLVTRLGKKGKRQMICFGPEVTTAEALQLRSAGKEIRIAEPIYDAIMKDVVRDEFREDANGAYVSKALTFPKIDEKEEEAAAKEGALSAVAVDGNLRPSRSVEHRARPWGSPKPWSPE